MVFTDKATQNKISTQYQLINLKLM